LVEHFLQKHSRSSGAGQPVQIEAAAATALNRYFWPGNVRELENAVERACALCDGGMVRVSDLPPNVARSAPPVGRNGRGATQARGGRGTVKPDAQTFAKASFPTQSGGSLAEFIAEQERLYIEETIRAHNGSRDRAAEVLGISTATLYRKMDSAGKRSKRR
jgi:DNA-binding NtrC family response regulator